MIKSDVKSESNCVCRAKERVRARNLQQQRTFPLAATLAANLAAAAFAATPAAFLDDLVHSYMSGLSVNVLRASPCGVLESGGAHSSSLTSGLSVNLLMMLCARIFCVALHSRVVQHTNNCELKGMEPHDRTHRGRRCSQPLNCL